MEKPADFYKKIDEKMCGHQKLQNEKKVLECVLNFICLCLLQADLSKERQGCVCFARSCFAGVCVFALKIEHIKTIRLLEITEVLC